MVISRDAVAEFLDRPRRSFARLKRYTRADILEEIDSHGVPRRFVTRPRLHQLVCYLIGVLMRRWLFFLDMGMGKTKIVLDLLNGARMVTGDDRLQALVFVPKLVHMGSWDNQVDEHSDFTVALAWESNIERKWEVLATSDADITVIDYQGFGLACTRLAKVAGKSKRVRDDSRVKALRKRYAFLAFDEIHRCKSRDTIRFGMLRQLVKGIEWRFGLSGTPIGRNPEDFWAEFFLIDDGETLGETIALYRQALFTEKKNYFGGTDYVFDKRNAETLRRILRNRSITYDSSEAPDLPRHSIDKKRVRLSAEQREAYNKLVEGQYIEVDGVRVRVPIDGVFHRMREITSGYRRERVNGVPVTTHYKENPKLEALRSYIEDIPATSKFIVFYEYKPTGEMLQALMRELRIKCLVLDGSTKDPLTIESRFKNDESIRGLLANSASGGEGINAQRANYQLYFEAPVSPITRSQSIRRAWRDGQTRPVFTVDFVVQGSVDERILEFLAEGRDMLNALTRGSRGAQVALFGRV